MSEAVAAMVARVRADPRLELETRLGTCAGDKFVPGVTREHMNRLIEAMETHARQSGSTVRACNDEWVETEDYHTQSKGQMLRTRVTFDDTVRSHTQRKQKLETVHLHSHALDVRVALSLEEDVQPVQAVRTTYVRIKQTRRFECTRSPFVVTCSMSWSGATWEEAERRQSSEEPKFEVECELEQGDRLAEYLRRRSDAHVARSLLAKTADLMLVQCAADFTRSSTR